MLYARSIPRLEALREIRQRHTEVELDPEGWKNLFMTAYRDKDLAEKAEAAAMLAQSNKNG